jgi:thymidine kinase
LRTHPNGLLIVITGPMYATKSQSTRAIFEKYCIFNRKGVWIKPDTDNRCAGKTVTHDNRVIASAITISSQEPELALADLIPYDVVVFDEAQFFSEKIVGVIKDLLGQGKIVIVNGLKLTAGDSIFGSMHFLLAFADEIISLKSVCNVCNAVDSATRTRAFNKNNPIVKVGGASDYYVVCPECDNEKKITQD